MKNLSKFILVVASLMIIACQPTNKSDEKVDVAKQENTLEVIQQQPETKELVVSEQSINAEVKYFTLEGGFFGLIAENGEKLLPINLAKSYQVNGYVVKVTGEKLTDVVTTKLWGTPFKIKTIELIKSSELLPHPQG